MKRFILLYIVLFLLQDSANADVITPLLLSLGASFAVAAAVTNTIIATALSAGLSLAASALFNKRQNPAFGSLSNLSNEIIENRKGTTAYIPVVYGRHKVGGIRVYEEVDDNNLLYLVTVFCEGEIDSIETIFIDGEDATDSKFSTRVDAYTFFGTDDQSVETWTHAIDSGNSLTTFLATGKTGWTTNHRVRGCAGVALILAKDRRTFPRIPVITAVVKGKKVYDPRDGTTAYSTNPALCIRDYYTNTRYGARITSGRLDTTSFDDAANFFDQTTDYGNGSQKRFEINGVVNTSGRVWDNIEDLMLACNSLPTRVNGKHGILPLKSESTVFNFTDDNVTSGIKVKRLGKRFKKNKVNAQYIDPNNNWQTNLYIEADATFKAADNGIELVNELELRHITDHYLAGHITRIALRQSRLEEKYTFSATHEALKVEVGDVVDLTHSIYGFSSKQMRVIGITLEPTGFIGIEAEEYDSTVYSVSSSNAPKVGGTTTFADPFNVPAPGSLAVSQTFNTNSAGFVVNIVTLTWQAPAIAGLKGYIVEYKESTSSDWIIADEPENETGDIVDLKAGTYDFAVSAVNQIGRVSSRSSLTSVAIVDNTATPSDVTNFTHEFTSGNQIVFKWDKNTDVTQGGGYRIKHSSKTSGAGWNDFPQLNVLIDGRETTATLGILEGTYMIKAENIGGTQSATEQSIPVILPDNDEWVSVSSISESTQFIGTHSNTEESTGTLTLTATTSGGLNTSGTYTWSNQIDLGGTFAMRLTRVSSGTLSNTASNWDSFGLNMDDYTSTLIDDMAGASSVDVKHFFRTSTQNSTGPWGDYHRLQMAEPTARYISFQTTIDTDVNTENTNIQELSAAASMKRRVESAYNVSVTSSGGSITFDTPFYAAPNINVNTFNASAGERVTVTTSQITRSGFEVSYVTSSGGGISGTISWAAFGYGKEIT